MNATIGGIPRAMLHSGSGRRRGAMLVLICFLMVVFLVFVVFSVDVAYMHRTRTQLRIATDSAARAAGETLSREQDISAAREAAKRLAEENLVAGQPLILEDDDIEFGASVETANGSWSFVAGATPTNSVRVLGRRTEDSPSGAAPLFFAPLLGVNHFQPTQTATVVKLDRDLCLVLDRSSSMKLAVTSTAPTMSTSDLRFSEAPRSDSRWAALADAVDGFVAALDETPQTEQTALVSFSSDGTWNGVVNVAASIDQPLTTNEALVDSAADAIGARVFNGMTHTSAGVAKGVEALTDPARSRPYARKTMVFLTDGQRTVGPSPLEAALTAKSKNIVIHTITFGATFDQSEMIEVADVTGGQHYHAPDAATLSQVFREIALSLPVVLTE